MLLPTTDDISRHTVFHEAITPHLLWFQQTAPPGDACAGGGVSALGVRVHTLMCIVFPVNAPLTIWCVVIFPPEGTRARAERPATEVSSRQRPTEPPGPTSSFWSCDPAFPGERCTVAR